MGHTRMYVTALTALLVPASVGVVTVHASPTCEKFVRTHVTVPVRNRVSKATAIAWEKWRVGHPNWKPNPKVKRPRYRMSQREMLDKVGFACEVPTEGKPLEVMFPLAELQPPLPEIAPPAETPDVPPPVVPPVVPPSPPVAELVTPPSFFVVPPYIPPLYGGPVMPPGVVPNVPAGTAPSIPVSGTTVPVTPLTPVPEPSSLLLLALGTSSGGAMAVRSRRARAAASGS